jgi:hypothetical protein
MKDSEEAIEKVLTGLRGVGAPDGMERRILEGLQGRASARPRLGWRQVLPIGLVAASPVARKSLTCGAALAGVFALAMVASAIRRSGHAPVQSKVSVAPVELVPLANSESFPSEAGVTNIETTRVSTPGPGVRAARVEKARRARAEVVDDSDALALQEMRAPSRPAPPMPLTEQEKLLLRIAHHGAPEELMALSPLLRAARDEEEKAEVQQFFEPRTTEDNE